MAFYELYRLNTVLLLPRSGWIFKVQHFTGWIWSQPLGALEFAHVAQQRHTTGAVGEPLGIDKLGSGGNLRKNKVGKGQHIISHCFK
jgi:hypothetical protein